LRLQPWDVQALVPIIEGAGGVITAARCSHAATRACMRSWSAR
jgi:fructose-1,6-bisphosphatase/inositol monophosphatase family enzyme